MSFVFFKFSSNILCSQLDLEDFFLSLSLETLSLDGEDLPFASRDERS